MKLFLFALLISISLSSILVFADSEDDELNTKDADLVESQEVMLLSNKGIEFTDAGNYEEAIAYFDKALEIDPDNVLALTNKGGILGLMGKHYDAHLIFQKVVEIMPENLRAHDGLQISLQRMMGAVDGLLEITIRNSQGHLVGYITTSTVAVLDSEDADKIIDEWTLIKTMSRNGQEVDVLQHVTVLGVNTDKLTYARMNLALPGVEKVMLIVGEHNGIQLDKGDVVTLVFTLFRPIE